MMWKCSVTYASRGKQTSESLEIALVSKSELHDRLRASRACGRVERINQAATVYWQAAVQWLVEDVYEL